MLKLVPRIGGNLTRNWAIAGPDPSGDPAPMDAESPPSTRSTSVVTGAQTARKARRDTQMEIDIAQDDAAFRDRFRRVPNARQTVAGSGPLVSTKQEIENAFRNPR